MKLNWCCPSCQLTTDKIGITDFRLRSSEIGAFGTVMVWWFTSWAKYRASWSFTNNDPVDGRNPDQLRGGRFFGREGCGDPRRSASRTTDLLRLGLLPHYLQGSIHPMCSCFIKHFGTDGWAPFSVFANAKIDMTIMTDLWPERGSNSKLIVCFFLKQGISTPFFAVGLGISFLRSQFWKRPHPSRNSTQPQR